MSKVKLLCRPEGIESLYQDGVNYKMLLGTDALEVRRNSHVDPLPGPGVCWGIFWSEEWQPRFGKVTTEDDQGRPFTSKRKAVDYEVRLLEQAMYK